MPPEDMVSLQVLLLLSIIITIIIFSFLLLFSAGGASELSHQVLSRTYSLRRQGSPDDDSFIITIINDILLLSSPW